MTPLILPYLVDAGYAVVGTQFLLISRGVFDGPFQATPAPEGAAAGLGAWEISFDMYDLLTAIGRGYTFLSDVPHIQAVIEVFGGWGHVGTGDPVDLIHDNWSSPSRIALGNPNTGQLAILQGAW